MPTSFDNDLFLELARKWPAEALPYLHRHFFRKLVHVSFARTNNKEASEDIVQDVLIDVWQRISKLTRRDNFLVVPYLYMMVRKKSITYFWSTTIVHTDDPSALDLHISELPSVEERLSNTDFHQSLREIVNRLPRRERRCLQLKFFEDMSNDSIATELKTSKKTVERWLTCGLRLLRERLSPKK